MLSGTAGAARPGPPALFSLIVLYFLPAHAWLQGGVPVAAPMATAGCRPPHPDISCLLFPCPPEAAPVQGLPLSTSPYVMVLLPMACPTDTPLSATAAAAAAIHRHSTRGSGRRLRGPWDRVALGPHGGHPASCLQPPLPRGRGRQMSHTKMCPGAVKINDRIFCKIPSNCNKVY